MEKLVQELIDRLEEAKKRIIDELKNNPVDVNDKISLLLSGEALAYDSCIKELQRLVDYATANKLKLRNE